MSDSKIIIHGFNAVNKTYVPFNTNSDGTLLVEVGGSAGTLLATVVNPNTSGIANTIEAVPQRHDQYSLGDTDFTTSDYYSPILNTKGANSVRFLYDIKQAPVGGLNITIESAYFSPFGLEWTTLFNTDRQANLNSEQVYKQVVAQGVPDGTYNTKSNTEFVNDILSPFLRVHISPVGGAQYRVIVSAMLMG